MRLSEEFRERTKRYASAIVRCYVRLPRSRKEVEVIALQEADESQLWLELLQEDCAISGDEIAWLHAETGELIAILVTVARKTKLSRRGPEPVFSFPHFSFSAFRSRLQTSSPSGGSTRSQATERMR